MQLRPLITCLLAVSAAILLPACNSSDSEIQADTKETCTWLAPELEGGPCGDDAWASLADWRAAQPVLQTRHLGFTEQGDPVEEAMLQKQKGFQGIGREDLPRWPLKLPLKWNADPFKDTNWRFQLHAWRMMDPLLLAWLETGDERYVTDSMALVRDWYAQHIADGLQSTYEWYDMATGIRAMKIAFLFDRALRQQFSLTDKDRRMLLELAQAHVQKLMEPALLATGNHGLFQLHGLIALCKTVPQLGACSGAVEYAETALNKLLGQQFSAEGIHLEHSPWYHFFITDTVSRMLSSGWYEEFEQTKALMRKAEKNKIWLVHPDMRDVTVGDSEGLKHSLTLPPGRKACANTAEYGQDCYLLQVFPLSGYAIVRSDWAVPTADASMLFFMAAFHSAGHKHADDLSFELFEFGERVLTDSGQYSYTSGPFRDYVLSTRAHNTVEINGRSYSLRAADAYGSALKSAERFGASVRMEAQATHKSLGAKHRRVLAYAPRKWLVVADRVEGDAIDSVTQWFHFSPQVQLIGPQQTDDSNAPYWATLSSGRQIRIEQYAPKCRAELIVGRESPIQGWSTTSYGVMKPRAALGYTCSGEQRSLVALLTLDEAFRTQALEAAATALREMEP